MLQIQSISAPTVNLHNKGGSFPVELHIKSFESSYNDNTIPCW